MPNPKKQSAGRKGGDRRAAKHTFEELSDWGKKGGRPKLPTYTEIIDRRRASEADSSKGQK